MNMFLNDDVGAGARTVPVFWRDSAWSVRIFVRTRIRVRRQEARAQVFDSNDIVRSLGLKISDARRRHICDRSAAFRLQRSAIRPEPIEGRRHRKLAISRVGTVANSRRRRHRTSLQPKSCPPALPGLNAVVERLRPVLAFASSQLGGLAPSALRIYSVFGYSVPTTI